MVFKCILWYRWWSSICWEGMFHSGRGSMVKLEWTSFSPVWNRLSLLSNACQTCVAEFLSSMKSKKKNSKCEAIVFRCMFIVLKISLEVLVCTLWKSYLNTETKWKKLQNMQQNKSKYLAGNRVVCLYYYHRWGGGKWEQGFLAKICLNSRERKAACAPAGISQLSGKKHRMAEWRDGEKRSLWPSEQCRSWLAQWDKSLVQQCTRNVQCSVCAVYLVCGLTDFQQADELHVHGTATRLSAACTWEARSQRAWLSQTEASTQPGSSTSSQKC